jgi:hypothetical protein
MNAPLVYDYVSLRDLRRPALVAATILAVLLTAVSAARGDTTFGGDPTQEVTPGLTCQEERQPHLAGGSSCLWSWTSPSVGTDAVPFPGAGGSGSGTAVTLPAMPNPGPMQAVVLTLTATAGEGPHESTYTCCQVKAISPTFTVPANKITTVPLELDVSATRSAALLQPGESASNDRMAISVLSPDASLPLRYTGGVAIDGDFFESPAPTTSGAFVRPASTIGYQLLARFTYGPARAGAGGTGTGKGNGMTPGRVSGVKLRGNTFRPGGEIKMLTVGTAINPPTATTTQTLTIGAAHASAAGGKATKPIVLGKGKTTVRGKSAPIQLALNPNARAKLWKGRPLKATLTIVATNARGESQTVTRAVTVKPARPKKGAKR